MHRKGRAVPLLPVMCLQPANTATCHSVVARSKMRVVQTSVSNIVTTSLYDVAKTLSKRCYNVATTSTNGCVGAFQLRIIDNSFPTSKHKRATKLYWGKSTLSLNRSFCLQLKKSISTHLPRNIKINMYIKHNQLHSFIYKQINCTLIQISLGLGVKLLAFM